MKLEKIASGRCKFSMGKIEKIEDYKRPNPKSISGDMVGSGIKQNYKKGDTYSEVSLKIPYNKLGVSFFNGKRKELKNKIEEIVKENFENIIPHKGDSIGDIEIDGRKYSIEIKEIERKQEKENKKVKIGEAWASGSERKQGEETPKTVSQKKTPIYGDVNLKPYSFKIEFENQNQ